MKALTSSLCLAAACLVSCTLPPPVNRIADFSAAIGSIPEGWKDETIVVLADTVDLKLNVSKANPSNPNVAIRRECTWFYVNRRNPNLLELWSIADFENIENPASI